MVKIATTEEDGSLNFDNLSYDTRYRLRELTAPDGYWVYTDPAYLTISIGGEVQVEPHSYVKAGTSTFTINVTNRSADRLPETGGGGTYGYYAAGVMLMLLALCVAILPKLRKGRYRMHR